MWGPLQLLIDTDEEATDEDVGSNHPEGEAAGNGLIDPEQGAEAKDLLEDTGSSPQQLHIATVGEAGEEEVSQTLSTILCVLQCH